MSQINELEVQREVRFCDINYRRRPDGCIGFGGKPCNFYLGGWCIHPESQDKEPASWLFFIRESGIISTPGVDS